MNTNLVNVQRCLEKVDAASAKAKVFLNAAAAELELDVTGGPVAPIVPVIVTDPPRPIDPRPDAAINGHSLYADDEGFATVPEFETTFQRRVKEAKLSPKRQAELRAKLYWGIVNESVVKNCIFTNPLARLKARQNLIRRNSTIMLGLGGDNFTTDALLIKVTPKPVPEEIDYNADQEANPADQYIFEDLAVLVGANGHGRWSGNWDPKYSAAYFVNEFDKRITAELAPRDPLDGLVK